MFRALYFAEFINQNFLIIFVCIIFAGFLKCAIICPWLIYLYAATNSSQSRPQERQFRTIILPVTLLVLLCCVFVDTFTWHFVDDLVNGLNIVDIFSSKMVQSKRQNKFSIFSKLQNLMWNDPAAIVSLAASTGLIAVIPLSVAIITVTGLEPIYITAHIHVVSHLVSGGCPRLLTFIFWTVALNLIFVLARTLIVASLCLGVALTSTIKKMTKRFRSKLTRKEIDLCC